jgi:mannitol-1-/sugar-/sorbitol-6-/2-deoxyglucose-6-phosphatase
MAIKAVIFDMDGLLIDSEPIWNQAGKEALETLGAQLTAQQYASTTGLRTHEWLEYWFNYFNIPHHYIPQADTQIVNAVVSKIKTHGKPMPGVQQALNFFIQKNLQIGLASSSPMQLINTVVDMLGIRSHLHVITSAEHLPYGKPHPQVFINCVNQLGLSPLECIVFEDSFNGMIAAKAAKIKCVVVPEQAQFNDAKWGAADLKLSSLLNFNQILFERLQQ